MDLPGGRPTAGLEEAVRLLAEGAETAEVLREVVRVAARQTGGSQALVIARAGPHVVDVARHGSTDACLRSAAAEALAKGCPTRRSNPVEGINAGAIPVVYGGRVVAALAVAGPAEHLDPRSLDTAAAIVSLCLSRDGLIAVSSAPLETLSPLAVAPDRSGVAAAVLKVLERFTSGPAFVCLDEGGRLRVARYRGIPREELGALVGRPEFLDLVSSWRERPVPPSDPEEVRLHGRPEVLVCTPLAGLRSLGLLALAVAPEDGPAAARLLRAVAPHVVAALHRAQLEADTHIHDREVDGVVQASPLPVVVVDANACFLRVNAPACELFGLSGSFDAGRSARGRLGSPELEALFLDGDGPGQLDLELGVPRRAFRAIVSRIQDGPTRLGSVLVVEDVSARRLQEEARDEFVSVIGHELRTPLTVAKGFVETVLARSDQLTTDQLDSFLRTALGQTERLEDLINDLLFMSTERPREGARAEPADVYVLSRQVVERFARRFPERSIECMTLGGDAIATVDRRHVTHALRHLVDNAVKYSEGPVRVEVLTTADAVEVAVVDQGPGIFSGDLERLFRPFEQKDSSSTRHHGGTGMGLFLARRLIEAVGGRLDCDSRLGQGSRFSFRLPRQPFSHETRTPTPQDMRDDARP